MLELSKKIKEINTIVYEKNKFIFYEHDFGNWFPVYVDLDKISISEKSDLIFRETQYGVSPAQSPNYHNEYKLAKPVLKKRSQGISILNDYNASADVEAVINKYSNADGFLPLKTNEVDMTVLIDKNSENPVIKIVDLRPW